MYAGRVVEEGSVVDLLSQPRHPYTQGLLDSVPSRSARGARLRQIPGMTPNVLDLPQGCTFRDRCDRADAACAAAPSTVVVAGGAGVQRSVRCHHPLPGGVAS
jgi:peptide/nickel transport system ATP-binding protein